MSRVISLAALAAALVCVASATLAGEPAAKPSKGRFLVVVVDGVAQSYIDSEYAWQCRRKRDSLGNPAAYCTNEVDSRAFPYFSSIGTIGYIVPIHAKDMQGCWQATWAAAEALQLPLLMECTTRTPKAAPAVVTASANVEPLPPATNIGNVWSLSAQPCNGGGGNLMQPFQGAKAVIANKRVELPQIGYSFALPQVQDAESTVLKVRLDSRDRGVTDHYLLLATGDLQAPYAAIVVTPMPEGMRTRGDAFTAAQTLQTNLARGAGVSGDLTRVDGPWGEARELIVVNRVGTDCYPTSTFTLMPADIPVRSIGINRFAYIGEDLVEFALILRVPEGMQPDAEPAFARSMMDRFWLSLKPIDTKADGELVKQGRGNDS